MCTKTLELKNMELHESMKRFVASLSKVDTYTALLALQSKWPYLCVSKKAYILIEKIS